MRTFWIRSLIGLLVMLTACSDAKRDDSAMTNTQTYQKPIVYQIFTRLFGNKTSTNKAWGTLRENGVGKFNDINDAALLSLKELGVTHIWYTGVLHHASVTDYSDHGISRDDPDVIKGRAGSPYAVKDYYQVSPDLAVNVDQRMQEFEALIARTHKHGLKVIIDIVPNHVARHYESLGKPEGVKDFGADDDTRVVYARDNNFYYVPDQAFQVPDKPYRDLGDESHSLLDGKFDEIPAKWTGNGAREAKPGVWDWYETVRINYGVKPDGSYDFPSLPPDYTNKDIAAHATFWSTVEVPDSWRKYRDIIHFWMDKGVDGFRFDVAELVPVEVWSYLNSSIKQRNPEAFLLAEIYTPSIYRDYLNLGKMDYLYDKVGQYDSVYALMQGRGNTHELFAIHAELLDIEGNMLRFLENHDERRIASQGFAGDAQMGKPGMIVAATMHSGPVMLYFGQELGEPAEGNPGFGGLEEGTWFDTTIFDYWGVPTVQAWMNNGLFDGGQLSAEQAGLRHWYARLLNAVKHAPALHGTLHPLHSGETSIAYLLEHPQQRWLVTANFDRHSPVNQTIRLSGDLVSKLSLSEGRHTLRGRLGKTQAFIEVNRGVGVLQMSIAPMDGEIFEFLN
jgi:glycosidase